MRKRRPLRRRQIRSGKTLGWMITAAGLIILIPLFKTGSAVSMFMYQLFGIAVFALPFLLMLWGGILITRERRSTRLSGWVVKAAAGLLLFCWAVGTAELLSVGQSEVLEQYISRYGGLAGSLLFHSLNGVFSTGTSIFLSTVVISILISVLLRVPLVQMLDSVDRTTAAGRQKR